MSSDELVGLLNDMAGDPPYYAKASVIAEAAARIEALESQLAEARQGFALADKLVCSAIEHGFYCGDGNLERLAAIRNQETGEGR